MICFRSHLQTSTCSILSLFRLIYERKFIFQPERFRCYSCCFFQRKGIKHFVENLPVKTLKLYKYSTACRTFFQLTSSPLFHLFRCYTPVMFFPAFEPLKNGVLENESFPFRANLSVFFCCQGSLYDTSPQTMHGFSEGKS